MVTWPTDGASGGWGSKYYRDGGYNVVIALQMYLTQGDRENTSVSNVRLRSLQSVHSALFMLKCCPSGLHLGILRGTGPQ